MTIYRYDMTIPVRVVSALHSGGADEVPERPITDEDDRTVQPNAFVRNGLGEAILPGRSIKGAIRAAFEEHMNELGFSEEELKSLWGGEMRREVGTPREQRGIGTEEPLPLRASALTFHHAVVWDRSKGELPHRMSTAIDRATGGAADGALFAYEYLPVDTTFEIRVSAEAQEPAPDTKKDEDPQSTTQSAETKGTPPASPALVEKALKAVVTLLHGKFISLGGRTGAGWGRIELGPDDIRRTQVAIPAPVAEKEKPSSPLDQLLNPPQPEPLKEAALSTSFPSASTSIEIEWQAPSGLFIGMNKPEGIDSLEKDTVPAAPMRNWHLNDAHRADHGDASYPKSHMRIRPRCCFRVRRSAVRCGLTVLGLLAASSATATATAKVATNSRCRRMYTSSSPQIHSSCVTCSEHQSIGERSASTIARAGYRKKQDRISLLNSHATRSTELPGAPPTVHCIRSCCIRTPHGIRFGSTLTTPNSAETSARTPAIASFQVHPHQTRNASIRPSKNACEQLSFS